MIRKSRFFQFVKFYKKQEDLSLGRLLTAAREACGFSLEEVATKSALSQDWIRALESDCLQKNAPKTFFCDPGYQRLITLHYAKVLGLTLDEIRSQLPPLALLNPPNTTFLKNWNRVPKPIASSWMRSSSSFYFGPRLLASLWRIFLLMLLLGSVIYLWNILRHLHRVIR